MLQTFERPKREHVQTGAVRDPMKWAKTRWQDSGRNAAN
jgi:hypothetical protein